MNNELKIFGNHDEKTIAQIKRCTESQEVVRGAIMADGHLGYSMPIGGVVAYRDAISVSGVGFDIACGNLAIKTDAKFQDVSNKMEAIMDDVATQISFGVGCTNQVHIDHELFDDEAWEIPVLKESKKLASDQIGSVGGGNHYCDIFSDENENIWVGVHFGSRGLGHKTATFFLKEAGGKDGMDVPPTVLSLQSQLGKDYLRAMKLCGRYAYAGREYVTRHIVKNIIKANVVEEVHNNHNFAWEEEHFWDKLWVVRKGATPAFPGQKGFVGGTMGDNAVILEGVDSDDSKQALHSTVHGAGRVMSRTEAKGRFERVGNKKMRKPGLVRHDDMMKWMADKSIVLRGGDVDEAPQAYRRLTDVLNAQGNTIRVLHTLRPIGVAMAGKNIVDPYKD